MSEKTKEENGFKKTIGLDTKLSVLILKSNIAPSLKQEIYI